MHVQGRIKKCATTRTTPAASQAPQETAASASIYTLRARSDNNNNKREGAERWARADSSEKKEFLASVKHRPMHMDGGRRKRESARLHKAGSFSTRT